MKLIVFSEDEGTPDVLACLKMAQDCGAQAVVSRYSVQYPVDVVVDKAQWATHCVVLARGAEEGCLCAQLAVCVAMGVVIITDMRWFACKKAEYTEVVKHVTRGIEYKMADTYTQQCDRAFIVRLVMLVLGCAEAASGHVTISTCDVNRNTDAFDVLLWTSFIDWLWEGGPISDYVAPPQETKVRFQTTPGGTLDTEVHLLTPRSGRLQKVRKRGKLHEALVLPPMPVIPPLPELE